MRTWGDEKFRALTPIPPCGQGLWLFLITGPFTNAVPGLIRAGRAGMAEELGWEVEAFDEAFREAFAQGMVKADFKARLVWVPNALKHNRPESPNVVRSWGAEFDLMPECDLKREAFAALQSGICAMGEGFAKAFAEAFGKPSPKPSPKTSPNQEQEQEQKQKEQDPPNPPADAGGKKRGRGKKSAITFPTFLAACQEAGEKPIRKGDPILQFCDDAQIPRDFLALAWWWFSRKHADGRRRQADWRAHFRDCIRGNWAKAWWFPPEGGCALTTVGEGLRREREAELERQKIEQDAAA